MASGKKIFLIGCLGCGGMVLLILLLVGSCAGYFGYKAYQMGRETIVLYSDVANDYQDLDNQIPFEPPAEPALEDQRLNEYLDIRADAAAFAQTIKNDIGAIGGDLERIANQEGGAAWFQSIGSIGELVMQMAKLPGRVGKEHLQLLRASQMSPSEYSWQTRITLGTIFKASQQEDPEAAAMWDEYVAAFEQARKDFEGTNSNFGNTRINGNDIRLDLLIEKIDGVEFSQANRDLIVNKREVFVINPEAALIDYMALHKDQIISDLQGGVPLEEPPLAPQAVEQ